MATASTHAGLLDWMGWSVVVGVSPGERLGDLIDVVGDDDIHTRVGLDLNGDFGEKTWQ